MITGEDMSEECYMHKSRDTPPWAELAIMENFSANHWQS